MNDDNNNNDNPPPDDEELEDRLDRIEEWTESNSRAINRLSVFVISAVNTIQGVLASIIGRERRDLGDNDPDKQ